MPVVHLPADPVLISLAKFNVPLAVLAHQFFRRLETFSILIHMVLLFGPPTLVTLYLPSSRFLHTLRVSIVIYLAALVVSVVGYRISPFHPLARYPGPFRRRVSQFIPALYTIPGNQSKIIKALHEQYGDVVRIGPNEISIRDPAAIPVVMGTPGVPKGNGHVGGMLGDKNIPMVGIRDTTEHLRRRRPWNRGISQAAMKDYEQLLAARVHQLLQKLEEHDGELIIGNWFKYFSFDFICDMAFGGGSEMLRNGDGNNIWKLVEDGMVYATFFAKIPWLGVYVGYIPGAARSLQKLHSSSRELVMNRLKKGSTTRDLFYYLNNEDLPNKAPPPPRHLIDDGVLAVVAGADTTSIALTSLFYCISTHPVTYARLEAEVDKYYPAGENVYNPKHHHQMSYLQAVINEAMRLFPPVPGGGQRQVPQHGSPVVAGSIIIPPGTIIRNPPWSIHRDERNFTFPEDFWPERWLIASGEVAVQDARLPTSARGTLDETSFVHNEVAFIPFSHGPMNCVGKAVALLQMRTLVCALLQRFRVRLREGWDTTGKRYEEELGDYFTSTRVDLPVLLERR